MIHATDDPFPNVAQTYPTSTYSSIPNIQSFHISTKLVLDLNDPSLFNHILNMS